MGSEAPRTFIRRVAGVGGAGLAAALLGAGVLAAEPAVLVVKGPVMIELRAPVSQALTSNSHVAKAMLHSPTLMMITGLSVGRTTVQGFDAHGRLMFTRDVRIEPGGVAPPAAMGGHHMAGNAPSAPPGALEAAIAAGDFYKAAALGASGPDIIKMAQAQGRYPAVNPDTATVWVWPDGTIGKITASEPRAGAVVLAEAGPPPAATIITGPP